MHQQSVDNIVRRAALSRVPFSGIKGWSSDAMACSPGGTLRRSVAQRSQWKSLINLETIKERNKPIAPPKKPEAAPFFLPTVANASGATTFDLSGLPVSFSFHRLFPVRNTAHLALSWKSVNGGRRLSVHGLLAMHLHVRRIC